MSETPGHDQPLTWPEVDLATIAAAGRLDGYLVELIGTAEAGGGPVLGLLLSGCVVIGRLVDSAVMAEEVDKHIQTVFALAAKSAEDGETWRQQAEELAGTPQEVAAERKQEQVELMQRYEEEVGDKDLELTEMSSGLARDLIRDRGRTALTLANAKVIRPGASGPLDVPLMRVDVRQVDAWWVVQADPETGGATFSVPS